MTRTILQVDPARVKELGRCIGTTFVPDAKEKSPGLIRGFCYLLSINQASNLTPMRNAIR